MEHKPLSALTDQELLQEAKKRRTATIVDAVLIGFLAGIVGFSVYHKSFGILILIPVYIAYKLINKPKYNNKELDQLLKERGLK